MKLNFSFNGISIFVFVSGLFKINIEEKDVFVARYLKHEKLTCPGGVKVTDLYNFSKKSKVLMLMFFRYQKLEISHRFCELLWFLV